MAHELEGKKVSWTANLKANGAMKHRSKGKVNFVDESTGQAQVEYPTGKVLKRRFMIDIDRLRVEDGQ